MDPESASAPFASILAPVDGTKDSEIAVHRSLRLFRFPGVRVTLLTVIGEQSPVDGYEGRRVNDLATELMDAGVQTRVVCRSGAPAPEILGEISRGRHDLVLLSSRRRSIGEKMRPGRIVRRLLKRSPVPLMLFRPLCGLDESFFAIQRSEPAEFRRILVLLDGSAESERIFAPAVKLARAFGSELVLFHAMESREFSEEKVDPVRAYLAVLAEAANAAGVATRIQIAVGPAHKLALKELDRSADTLAFTTHGHSLLRTALAGSTASRLLSAAEGPLLCLPSTQPIAAALPAAAGGGDVRT